tara:strand:- start:61 stop:687 length:627 start_codon:yes stop_codon:yes gene_type:complete
MKKSKRVKKSNSWKVKQQRDQFFKKSKILGYRSRASFKLIELNEKFKFIKKSSNLLDLGAYPGGWSQVVSKIITSGKILSIDLKPMEEIKNVKFLQCNILDQITKGKIENYFQGSLDVILSDMAADTTGNKSLDSIRTNFLCSEVLNFSSKILKKKGVLVSKLFMGEDFIEVKNLAKSLFKVVNFYKPDSSRNESKETYIHCRNLKTL